MGVRVLDAAGVARALGAEPEATVVAEVLAATDGWADAVERAAARLAEDPAWVLDPRAVLGPSVREAVAAEPVIPALSRLPMFDDEVLRILAATCTAVPVVTRAGWQRVAPAVAAVARAAEPLAADPLLAIARHLHAQGETAAAVELVRDEGDESTVRAFVRDLHWTDLARLPAPRLADLVTAVGPTSPTLMLAAARAVELPDRPQRERWLAQAAELTDDPVLSRAIAAERARDTFRGGDVDNGLPQAEQVLAATGSDEPVTRARALTTIGMWGAFTCTDASLARAGDAYQEAAEIYRRAGERGWRADNLARLGYTVLYMAGHPARGAEAMSEALSLLPVGDVTRAYWLTNFADVLAFLGRDLEADAAVREAIDIGTRRHDDLCVGMAWWTRSWLAAQRGDRAALRAAIAEVEHHRGTWLAGGQALEFVASSAEHLALLGDHVAYAEMQERSDVLAAELGFDQPALLARATYDCLHGEAARGLATFADLEGEQAVVANGLPRRLLLQAVAHRRLGDLDASRSAAARSYDAAARLGVPDLHARTHRTLMEALGDDASSEALTPEPAAVLRMLGGWSLTVDGSERTPPPGHPSTLVKLLALHPSLSVDTTVDELWPDVDAATGRARLRNLVNRIKERSGPIVVREGEALRLDAAVVVDATAFEAAAEVALRAPTDQRVGLARSALALYAGDLLPVDLYDDRVTAARARLQRRMVSLADLAAEDATARGDLDEAARLLDLAIAAEPLDELRVLQLCDLLVRQGRPSQAGAVAARCAAVLEELGMEPGPELGRFVP